MSDGRLLTTVFPQRCPGGTTDGRAPPGRRTVASVVGVQRARLPTSRAPGSVGRVARPGAPPPGVPPPVLCRAGTPVSDARNACSTAGPEPSSWSCGDASCTTGAVPDATEPRPWLGRGSVVLAGSG
ncbi:hypothetical protein GCM10027047_12320 [Rhodococcus aerolatus]